VPRTRPVIASAVALLASLALLAASGCAGPTSGGNPADCPNGGTVRMGVQPFLAAAALTPSYQELAGALSRSLGCTVQVSVTTDYAAETEAMRGKQLEVAEFPPFGYVLAKDRANLVPVATFGDRHSDVSTATAGIAVLSSSPVTDLRGLAGQTVAFTAPTATSGHLLPAYGLQQAGIDPNAGIAPVYLGTHTAVYQALLTGRVAAAELASTQIAAATSAHLYDPARIRMLWTSAPSPSDPIVVRGDLTPEFRQRFTRALLELDFEKLSPPAREFFHRTVQAYRFVPADDSTYTSVRAVVEALHLTPASVR